MGTLTKDKLEEKVYWVIDGEDVRSGTYAEALSDKADCLDLPEVPRVVDHVIHERQDWRKYHTGLSGDSWYTVATHSSFEEAEAAVEDDERIVTRRVWDVMAGKDLICRCDSEEEAEIERLEYLRAADVDRDIWLFESEEHAKLYHAVMISAIECDDDECDAIMELVLSHAIML